MNFQSQLLAMLEAALWRPLILVAVAWLILRLLRVRHPASRHAVWTAVLVGMLVLPILSVITPDWTLRVLPWTQQTVNAIPSPTAPTVIAQNDPKDAALPILTETETSSVSPTSFAPPSIETLVVWGYLAGLLGMLGYRLIGWHLFRRVVSRSKSLRPTCLRESEDVVTPVAVGLLRPVVILPAGWRDWSARTKRVVLTHEFAHLRRRDTLVAALARVIKCLFWFHPVAWWVSRQTSDLAELACDAVALQRVGDPVGYSRVLVEFASVVSRSGQRVALPGLAMASGSRINDRVDQVFQMSSGTMRKLARPGVWLVALGLPALTLAATVELTSASAPVQHSGASARQGLPASTAGKPAKERFEAATIKPCPPEDTPSSGGARGTAGGTNASTSPGRFSVPCVTTEQLIYLAYASYGALPEERLQNDDFGTASSAEKVRGGPDWVHSSRDKYAIEAIAPGVTERTVLMGAMLRTLLEERFQLRLHRASEEVAMFALTVAKSGFKLKPMKVGECDPNAGPPPYAEGAKPNCGNLMMLNSGGVVRWTFSGSPLSSLASMLSRTLGVHVIDRTNITDRFMMQFNFVHEASGIRDASGRDVTDSIVRGPTVHDALNDQLGLKLDRLKAPREYIAIDHIQRPTPDNPPAAAEQAPGGKPKFDVVSIRPCPDVMNRPSSSGRSMAPWGAEISPGYVHWGCISLYELIHQAYAGQDNPLLNNRVIGPNQGDPWLVQGGPEWVMKDRFTIEVRVSGEVPRPDLTGSALARFRSQAMAPALRAMIEDRFQLKLRRVMGTRPMYALTVAKSGLKLPPATPGDCWDYPPNPDGTIPTGSGRGGGVPPEKPANAAGKLRCGAYPGATSPPPPGTASFQGGSITLAELAFFFSRRMDRWILDKTGVEGRFTFEMRFAADENVAGRGVGFSQVYQDLTTRAGAPPRQQTPPSGPNIFEALATLGLNLDRTNGPAEHFVIESVQKPRPNSPDVDELGLPARAQGAGR
jgi:uncharacterized protein (TIGR03435 family)